MSIFISVGTGGATGAMAPSLFGQNSSKIVSLLKNNFYPTNDPPGPGEHKSAQKCFLEGFVFAQDEMKVSPHFW